MKTIICLVLDRSGSMNGREKDVIGGVNKFIEEQKELKDPASMAFVRFDSEAVERFRPMLPLESVEPLGAKDFVPRSSTPLLDAVGKTIVALDADWKTEKPDRAIMIIVTDGQENCSNEYTKEKVKQMIEARQNSGLWAFIYLGANVDAFAEAHAMGINTQNSAGYTNSTIGTQAMYRTVSASATHMRATGQTIADNLGGTIAEDPDAKAAIKPTAKGTQDAKSDEKTTWTPPADKPSASGTWSPPA